MWILTADGEMSLITRSNQFVISYWDWLLPLIVTVAATISLIQYFRDLNLEEPNIISTEPINGDAVVSVLVPAWNESEMIERTISAFKNISYVHKELIICAGGEDDTYKIAADKAQKAESISVIRQTESMNKQAALNKCLEFADGCVFYLIDGDCVLDDRTWNAALRPVIENGEDVVAGTSRPLTEQWGQMLPTYQYIKEEYERSHRPAYVGGLLGRNAVVSAQAIEDIGGFDESISAGTDYNLAKRLLAADYQIRFVPNSKIQSEYAVLAQNYLAQQSRWLRNVYFLGRKWNAHDEARTTILTCTIGIGMLIAPVLGIAYLPVMLIWVFLILYGLLTRFRWIGLFKKSHTVSVPSYLPIVCGPLMLFEFVTWAYALVEILIPSRRRKW